MIRTRRAALAQSGYRFSEKHALGLDPRDHAQKIERSMDWNPAMSEAVVDDIVAVVDDIVAVLPPLLQSLEALSFVARHLNPPDFDSVMEAAGSPDQELRAILPRLADWPEQFANLRNSLEAASDAALAAFAGLREVQHGNGDMIAVFRAL